MTYPEIMAQWNKTNRRLWPYFVMPAIALPAFMAFVDSRLLNPALALVGIVAMSILASIVYGDFADELKAISSLADAYKMQWLIDDLGEHASDMPITRILSNQEMGNFRYPSRLTFTVKGVGHIVVYDWEKRRFGRYKWPFLPYSLDKSIARAKAKT